MTDDELLQALEQRTLNPAEFGHRGHIRAAFAALRADPLGGGARVAAAIRAYATGLGAATKYDEGLTRFWIHAVGMAMTLHPTAPDADELMRLHPGLLDKRLRERLAG
jgi:hypothetical protein